MTGNRKEDRINFLADVAEMYFIEGLNQSEIAKRVGVTRSMVSRLITEARERGIVKVSIERRFSYDDALQKQLVSRFGLKQAVVFNRQSYNNENYLDRLGVVAARSFQPLLRPEIVVGTAWGTSISSMIDALSIENPYKIKVVQLVGALGGRNLEFDGHAIVRRLVEKLGGEGFYLNVPYIVDSPETVEALSKGQGVVETLELMKKCDMGIFGVGSLDIDYSTFYSGGYLVFDEIQGLTQYGAVGNVCGLFFDEDGNPTAREFQNRSFTIRKQDLLNIPIRLGIAGGEGKTEAILGALRGDYINFLITDNVTAAAVLGA